MIKNVTKTEIKISVPIYNNSYSIIKYIVSNEIMTSLEFDDRESNNKHNYLFI